MTKIQIRTSGVPQSRFHEGPVHDDIVKIHDLLNRGYTLGIVDRSGTDRVLLKRIDDTTHISTYHHEQPRPITTREPWVSDLISMMKAHDPSLRLEDTHDHQATHD